MHLFTTFRPKLSFEKLSSCSQEHIRTAATWIENEWGYIRNKGVEERIKILHELKDSVYIGFYGKHPVALFAVFPHEHLQGHSELMYVYVDEQLRGLGLGKQIINQAKLVSSQMQADNIVLDTLKTSLNGYYCKFGARVVCESRLYGEPTDILVMPANNAPSSSSTFSGQP